MRGGTKRSSYREGYYPSMVDMLAGILFMMMVIIMGLMVDHKVLSEEERVNPDPAVQQRLELEAFIQEFLDYMQKQLQVQGIQSQRFGSALVLETSDVFENSRASLNTSGQGKARKVAEVLQKSINWAQAEPKRAANLAHIARLNVSSLSRDTESEALKQARHHSLLAGLSENAPNLAAYINKAGFALLSAHPQAPTLLSLKRDKGGIWIIYVYAVADLR